MRGMVGLRACVRGTVTQHTLTPQVLGLGRKGARRCIIIVVVETVEAAAVARRWFVCVHRLQLLAVHSRMTQHSALAFAATVKKLHGFTICSIP
jgi:hypothetical protein